MEDRVFSIQEVNAAVGELNERMQKEIEGRIDDVLTLYGTNRQSDGPRKGRPLDRGDFTDVIMETYRIENRTIADALINKLPYDQQGE